MRCRPPRSPIPAGHWLVQVTVGAAAPLASGLSSTCREVGLRPTGLCAKRRSASNNRGIDAARREGRRGNASLETTRTNKSRPIMPIPFLQAMLALSLSHG